MNKEQQKTQVNQESLATNVGVTFDIVLKTDANAALRTVNKRGVGKTRHIDTQEAVAAECSIKSRNGSAENRRRRERRGHTPQEHGIRSARNALGKYGIHQDNKTRDGR